MNKFPMWLGVFGGILATILIAIVVWLGGVYTGAYNVAATDWHADAVRWTLDTTMHRSVANRAEDVKFPETVPQDLFAEGAELYAGSCVHCHGAPGRGEG